MAGYCVSIQNEVHDAACHGCPACGSRSPVGTLPSGRRAQAALSSLCGVIRVADIHFSRFSEGRFKSPHYPSRKNGYVDNRIHKKFIIFFIKYRFASEKKGNDGKRTDQ